jgi:hypothetical protein
MSCYIASISTLATVFGAANSLVTRDLFQLNCHSSCSSQSSQQLFSKPVYATLIGFLAMTLSVPVAMLQGYIIRRKNNDQQMSSRSTTTFKKRRRTNEDDFGFGGYDYKSTLLLTSSINDETSTDIDNSNNDTQPLMISCIHFSLYKYIPLIVPTIFDVLATALQSSAVLFISAGINASLRGTLLFFTAFFAILLKSKEQTINRIEKFGIFLSTLGASLVGVSAILDSGSDGGSMDNVILGCSLSLLSNIVQGLQVAVETKFIETGKYTALEVNGAEGIIGSIILVFCLLIFEYTSAPSITGIPFDNGHIEDSINTICCLSKSNEIMTTSIILLILFAFSTGFYILLSKISGNLRSFCMVARALVVWSIELALSAIVPTGSTLSRFGAPWLEHSYIAAIGGAVLLIGGLVTWRGKSSGEEEQDKNGNSESNNTLTNENMSRNDDGKIDAVLARLNKGIGALEMVEFRYRGID